MRRAQRSSSRSWANARGVPAKANIPASPAVARATLTKDLFPTVCSIMMSISSRCCPDWDGGHVPRYKTPTGGECSNRRSIAQVAENTYLIVDPGLVPFQLFGPSDGPRFGRESGTGILEEICRASWNG